MVAMERRTHATKVVRAGAEAPRQAGFLARRWGVVMCTLALAAFVALLSADTFPGEPEKSVSGCGWVYGGAREECEWVWLGFRGSQRRV
eukprot:111771-Chlamydomonas_euryale.AAC.1